MGLVLVAGVGGTKLGSLVRIDTDVLFVRLDVGF